MPRKFLALPLILPLALLAGCTQKADFDDEAEKREAFNAAKCAEALQMDQEIVASLGAAEVLANPDAYSEEDQLTALDVMQYIQGAAAIDTVPLTVEAGSSGTCSGWVWSAFLESKETEYDDFTYQDAVDSGIYD